MFFLTINIYVPKSDDDSYLFNVQKGDIDLLLWKPTASSQFVKILSSNKLQYNL